MHLRHLELLACPSAAARSRSATRASAPATNSSRTPRLRALLGALPVRRRVPRFVPDQDYAGSFGWQWNRYARLQRDSYNGTTLVRDTLFKRSGWQASDLAGKCVLECGCGSGNDSEVLASAAGTLVSLDLSAAVDAFDPALLARANVLVLQADLRRAPLRPESFDVVFCHRVIQHTPDPRASFGSMQRFVRSGASSSCTATTRTGSRACTSAIGCGRSCAACRTPPSTARSRSSARCCTRSSAR